MMSNNSGRGRCKGVYMAGRSKVQNMQEVLKWLEEGRTYSWMQEQYLKKYNIETTVGMWASIRHRHGIPLRQERDEKLIPWTVLPQHRHAYPLAMLRVEARRRRGDELRETDASRLASWREALGNDRVVHYDPDLEGGFFLVPRREGIDLDLIREPSVR